MLDAAATDKLRAFGEMLRVQAAPRGLIGFAPEAVEEQLARSLLLLEVLGRPERLVDVGSGAGLPGIPLMIVLGNGVLVEPKRRAAAFLEEAIRYLDLAGSVFVGMAEEAGRGPLREWGDAVVARAVGSPVVTAELCSPLCAEGGIVLLTASPEATAADLPEGPRRALGLGSVEIRSLGPSAACSLGPRAASALQTPRTPVMRSPAGDQTGSRCTGPEAVEMAPRRSSGEIVQRVLMMRKVEPTPSEFPRRPGTARRRLLGIDPRSGRTV